MEFSNGLDASNTLFNERYRCSSVLCCLLTGSETLVSTLIYLTFTILPLSGAGLDLGSSTMHPSLVSSENVSDRPKNRIMDQWGFLCLDVVQGKLLLVASANVIARLSNQKDLDLCLF